MEIWKRIEEFDNYEVSNYGRVRRVRCCIVYGNGIVTNYKEKILKQEVNRVNYLRVTFSQNNIQKRFQVHRLVAKYFIENPENKPCVNHIDGNGMNNNISNLELSLKWLNEIKKSRDDKILREKPNPVDIIIIQKLNLSFHPP